VSISVGSAFCSIDGQTAEQLLTEADRRMYQSKRERRDSSDQPSLTARAHRAHV
jgi:GGDEF domain-containing protein